MNPFMLSKSDRLVAWREFRTAIATRSEKDQLHAIATWFSRAPEVNFSLDWENASSWPTAWEVLHEGDLCGTAIAYLMEQTLLMMGWDARRLQLIYLRDLDSHTQRMVLVVDNQWILNLSHAEVYEDDGVLKSGMKLARYQFVDGARIGG